MGSSETLTGCALRRFLYKGSPITPKSTSENENLYLHANTKFDSQSSTQQIIQCVTSISQLLERVLTFS